MRNQFFKCVVVVCAVLLSGCSTQRTHQEFLLDINPDPETVLSFRGNAYELSTADAVKLQAIAEEMAESFYWHSLPQPDLLKSLNERKLPWTPRKSNNLYPSPAFKTPSSVKLLALIDQMHAGFAVYQKEYRKAHPGSSARVGCSADSELCEHYVGHELRAEIRELRNVYISEVLDKQLGRLGQVNFTSESPAAQVNATDKPFVLILGEYKVRSLSEKSADSLFKGRTFMAGMSRYPCVFLVEKVDEASGPLRLNVSNTAFCGFKPYSGISRVARYLDEQSGT